MSKPKTRQEALNYLGATLRSLVPDQVIYDLWDSLLAPLYDGHGPDSVRTATDTPDKPVRTELDKSGHVFMCGRCAGVDRPCPSCADRRAGRKIGW